MGTVSVIQYVHPNGIKREAIIELPDEVCVMAKKQVLSCECMPNDDSKVVIYSHPLVGWDENEDSEECMFADNVPDGDKNPTAVLERIIRKVDAEISRGFQKQEG
jgi:hypothetical protein